MCLHCWEGCYCDGEGKCECVFDSECTHVSMFSLMWSVNHVLCSECKVQNSPVSNKTELQSRKGIPLHSTDSASPGGWINVCACTHSHKQSLFSHSRPTQLHISDQSHSKQSLQTDWQPTNTQDVRDSSWYGDVCFSDSLWRKQSQQTHLSNSHNLKQDCKIIAYYVNP